MEIIVIVVAWLITTIIPATSSQCIPINDQDLPQTRTCCNAPKFLIPKTIVNDCTRNCSISRDTCCIHVCVPLQSGLFVDGKMRKWKVKQFFEAGIDENDGVETVRLWKLLVAQTTEECFIKFRPSRKLGTCMPEHYSDILNCIKLENFLRCPMFNGSEKCEQTRANLRNCDRNSTIF